MKLHYESKEGKVNKILPKKKVEKMGGAGGGVGGGMTTSGTGAGVITTGMGSYPKRRKRKKK